MPLINAAFTGKMNLDTQAFRIQNGDYLEAFNITRDSPGEGEDMVVTNIVGNQLVSYNLPTGINKVIGKFPDKIRNRVYIAIWNSYDQDLWVYYDRNNDTIVTLIRNLVDTDGDVLQFDPSYRINHIDIIYRDTEGDLLFWVAGNVSPRKMNVQHIQNGNYTTIKTPFIEAAKAPLLSPPTCVYGSDSNINSNSLRRKLFQFCTRPQYDDFEKGVFFSFSKIPLPIGYYGSDNDFDNTKNNFITITIPDTGDENVIALEIGMRYNIGAAWSDVVLVASLNKQQLGISNNSSYQFLFYNDAIYPTITEGVQYLDGVQSIPLFFWTPQLADCQALANGNVPVYAAITEGYNPYPVGELDVTLTAENVTNIPPDADPPSITYEYSGADPGQLRLQISSNVTEGTVYNLSITTYDPFNSTYITYNLTYTALAGDDNEDVAFGLELYAQANYPNGPGGFGNEWTLDGVGLLGLFPVYQPYYVSVNIAVPSSAGTISTEKVWMNDCPYVFGLVYFDDQGRVMPGVITYANPVNSDNDFVLTTPSFSEDTGNRQTPVISASINHLPPTGAVEYCWVRRRMQYTNWLEYETCDFQSDSDFYYLCLNNIEEYKDVNTQFIYGTAPITAESRLKVIAGISSSNYDSNVWNLDFQIIGTVTKTLTGGSSPADDRTFIKIKAPASTPSPVFQDNMLVMVYSPMQNPTNLADSVYYEWGETYDTYELDGVLYHEGADQNQTASQPATFTWEEGDVYFHERTMYKQILSNPTSNADTVSIMDENYSDFFQSNVNDNGRSQVIEVNAQHTYNPVLIRHGGEYQAGTSVNNTAEFYYENFIEADRQYGDIRKLYIRDRYLRTYQKFKVGIVPILLQIIRDTAGNPLEANSEILLNKINYPYSGNYGIGDVPESFAADNYADYFVDDYRGVVCRLSQDGITVISILYECNSFFTSKLPYYRKSLNNGYGANGGVYTGDPTVYGVFDAITNKYIVALEEINRYNSQGYLTFHQDPYTLVFNETRGSAEGFETFLNAYPENMVCIDTLLLMFKDGGTWKHGFGDRCNFFGTQYDASITPVFNTNSLEKKSWQSVTELASDVWECPIIYTNVNAYRNQRQESKLIPQNFSILEGNPSSAILRDIHSNGGWVNGSQMKGNYIVINFLKQDARDLIYLNGVSVLFKDSPLTPR